MKAIVCLFTVVLAELSLSQNVFGFFVASGGRVVVYADTPVNFVPNP